MTPPRDEPPIPEQPSEEPPEREPATGPAAAAPDLLAQDAPGLPRSARGPLGALRRVNESDRLIDAAERLRRRLPGDPRFGDALSTAESGPSGSASLTRRIARLAGQQTGGLAHEVGLGALQVWQAAAESKGRGRGTEDLTVLFTDLVGFSRWALEAGDPATLLLLREVAAVLDPAVARHRGRVVKWLGDGMMAVLPTPEAAVEAAIEGRDGLRAIEIAGFQPRIRAGIHRGRPRRVGGDYLGVDVNIAARVADAATADELLASDAAVAGLDEERWSRKRKRRFRAKGVPAEVTVYSVRRRG